MVNKRLIKQDPGIIQNLFGENVFNSNKISLLSDLPNI